eukprot:CAMPEP_0172169214 /NCGR_PEP_ID=MMETSP1050-20130122/10581_1 /TAXON_ID=233186 /ORGANISM="Cryptomonas curvata, Strain CCAP979/52" /LENGTH=1462 /DNA_ID=CAMNT_0012840247 /DNA_START=2726 /DNA_END=7114 /DNA_ORIENTATION=+
MTASKLSKFSHENQQCSACPDKTYIIDPNRDVCQSCPKGALCLSGKFSPLNGSSWDIEEDARDGTRRWRIVECPQGYLYYRDEEFANQDNCEPCEKGTYLLQQTSYNSRFSCLPCPVGGICPGKNIVLSKENYWLRDKRQQRAISENRSALRAEIFRCSPKTCQGENKCNNNATGPVCGVCRPGWAFTSSGCVLCPSEDRIAPIRNAAIVLFLFCFCIVWYRVSWRALFPRIWILNWIYEKALKWFSAYLGALDGVDNAQVLISSIGEKIKLVSNLASKYNVTQYVKIMISYFQVLSSFVSFQVEWPSLLVNIMVWLKVTFNFAILELPGLSCLWAGIAFQSKLLAYTIVPLTLALLFLLPVIVEFCIKCIGKESASYRTTVDFFWNNIMFLAFLVYPMVSLMTLQAFNCQPLGLGLLAADYRESCPIPYSFLRNYSTFFILVYPIGIPLWMLFVMRGMKVHELSKSKVDSGLISSMIALFVKRASSVESRRLAQLIGDPQNTEEFNRRCLQVYNIYFRNSLTTANRAKIDPLPRFNLLVAVDIAPDIGESILQYADSTGPSFEVKFGGKLQNANASKSINGVQWEETFLLCVNSVDSVPPELFISVAWNTTQSFALNVDLTISSDEVMSVFRMGNMFTKSIPFYAQDVGDVLAGIEPVSQIGGIKVQLQLMELVANIEERVLEPGVDQKIQDILATGIEGTDFERLKIFIKTFDKDGDGEIDEDEFLHMARRITDVVWLFTGAENGDNLSEKLSDRQLKALLKHKWPVKNDVAQDELDPQTLKNVIEHIQEQSAAKQYEDEKNHLDEVDCPLDALAKNELLQKVLDIGKTLRKDGVLVLPQLVWNMVSPEYSDENVAIRRVGFLFLAYRVEYWYWEAIEMFRKFLMTSLLVAVVYPGEPAQLAAGVLITFCFLAMIASIKPYCTEGLSNLQSCTLISEFITLFAGIMLILDEKVLRESLDAGGQDDLAYQREIVGGLILISNFAVMSWPVLQVLLAAGDKASNSNSSARTLCICGKPETNESKASSESVATQADYCWTSSSNTVQPEVCTGTEMLDHEKEPSNEFVLPRSNDAEICLLQFPDPNYDAKLPTSPQLQDKLSQHNTLESSLLQPKSSLLMSKTDSPSVEHRPDLPNLIDTHSVFLDDSDRINVGPYFYVQSRGEGKFGGEQNQSADSLTVIPNVQRENESNTLSIAHRGALVVTAQHADPVDEPLISRLWEAATSVFSCSSILEAHPDTLSRAKLRLEPSSSVLHPSVLSSLPSESAGHVRILQQLKEERKVSSGEWLRARSLLNSNDFMLLNILDEIQLHEKDATSGVPADLEEKLLATLKRRAPPLEDPRPSSSKPFSAPARLPIPPSQSSGQWIIPSNQSVTIPTSAEFDSNGWKVEAKQLEPLIDQSGQAAAGVVRAIARGAAVRGESATGLRGEFPLNKWEIYNSGDRILNPDLKEKSAGSSAAYDGL